MAADDQAIKEAGGKSAIKTMKNALKPTAGKAAVVGTLGLGAMEAYDAETVEEAAGNISETAVQGAGAWAGWKLGAKLIDGLASKIPGPVWIKAPLKFVTQYGVRSAGAYEATEITAAPAEKAGQLGRAGADAAGFGDKSDNVKITKEMLQQSPEERLKMAMDNPALRLTLKDYFEGREFDVTLSSGSLKTVVPNSSAKSGADIVKEDMDGYVQDKLSRVKGNTFSGKDARDGIALLTLLHDIPEEEVKTAVEQSSGFSRFEERATRNVKELLKSNQEKENEALREQLGEQQKQMEELRKQMEELKKSNPSDIQDPQAALEIGMPSLASATKGNDGRQKA